MDGKMSKIVDIQPINIIGANLLRLDNVTVLGGNLCLTQRSLKTYWQPDFSNKIVVLEEIDEPPELVEIILNQIKTVGLFNNAKAIIFGQVYQITVNNQISIQAETSKNELYVKDLEDLVNYYNTRMYLDLKIDYSGVASPNVAIYNFQDLQNKVGVEDLTPEEKLKLIILFKPTDSVTRLETALLQFYQSKYITNATKITILWNPTSLQVQNKVEDTRTIDSVLREFAAKINLPVFKSNAFGHQSYNLPIPFGTSASLYSEKVSSCQGICNGFILEVKSPF
jgi:muramoyltetrapeptide carboxypeptidase LdcA involved in peptidoglycan recycling